MTNRTFRYAFIQAKIYGILSKSFLGVNYRDVLHLRRVQDVYDRIFPGVRTEMPETRLTTDLERRIAARTIETMVYVLDFLTQPPEILVHVLRRYETQYLKTLVRAVIHSQTPELPSWDLGRYGQIDMKAKGGPEKAIADSPYGWILPILHDQSVAVIENRIDIEYYGTLIELSKALPGPDRAGISRLVSLEVTLTNVIWALRLRFFYGLDWERAEPLLIPGSVDGLRKHVAKAFEIPPDSTEAWRSWKFGWILEDQLRDDFHAPDPIRAEERAQVHLYAKARQFFHQAPFTLTPLYSFFQLKEHEAALLKTAVESLHLSIPEQEIARLAGV
jgi:vacuolar-type H+-ATPase subunit C/Vma6